MAISVASRRSRSSEPLNVYRIRLGVPPPSGLDLLASRHGTSGCQDQSPIETCRLLVSKHAIWTRLSWSTGGRSCVRARALPAQPWGEVRPLSIGFSDRVGQGGL